MPIKRLVVDDQGVTELSPDDQENHFFTFNIQITEVAGTQLEFGERIGPEPLDGLGRHCRLICQSGQNRGLQDPALTDGSAHNCDSATRVIVSRKGIERSRQRNAYSLGACSDSILAPSAQSSQR
jgi:hypothetical protein